MKRENAKQYLDGYMQYYERWAALEEAYTTFVKKTRKKQQNLKELSNQYGISTSEISAAFSQVYFIYWSFDDGLLSSPPALTDLYHKTYTHTP